MGKVYRCFVEKKAGFDVEARGLCAALQEQLGVELDKKKMQQHMHSALRIIRTILINQSDLYALSLKTVHGELLMTLQSPSIR